MRRSGNRVRINVELIAIEEGYQVWSERYDRVMEDVFEIQDEISQAIVEKLKVKLVGREKERLAKRYTENLQAYNLCLRGRYYWYQRTPETIQKAMGFYEQALAKDPDYALAHSGLADCHTLLGFYGALRQRRRCPERRQPRRKRFRSTLTWPPRTLLLEPSNLCTTGTGQRENARSSGRLS